MKTLWPRTEPLPAEAIEPARFAGTGRGSGGSVARPSPLTVRRPASPAVPAHRAVTSPPGPSPATAVGAALALALLVGWLRVLAARGWARATPLPARHVPKFDQIDLGADGAPHHSTPRPAPTTPVSACGRRRAVWARDTRKGFHVRRDRSGGPPGLRRAGCRSAAGAGRGRAGPGSRRRGRCDHPQAAAPRFAGWSESPSSVIDHRPGFD
jgi:hypothetical protein